MGTGDVKEIYEEYKNKFDLPEFSRVDFEFEISSLDGDKFLLRTIRNKIKTRLENYCNTIEDLLTPDTSLPLLHECSYLTERDKKNLFNLFRKMMYMQRAAEMLEVEKKTKEDAKFIISFFNKIDLIKKEMKKITVKRMESWKKELSPYIKEEYFG